MATEKNSIVSQVLAKRLTYLDDVALGDLFDAVRELEQAGTAGRLIEAGCALGGSAIVMAAAKDRRRPLEIYDVFGLIPPPSERDGQDVHQRYAVIEAGHSTGIGGDTYYGYRNDLMEDVKRNFADLGLPADDNEVTLIPGLFQDTMTSVTPIALVHLDADWYDSVTVCLTRLFPHLVAGGRIIVDDYTHWSGCKRAVDDFFADKRGQISAVYKSRLHIIKTS